MIRQIRSHFCNARSFCTSIAFSVRSSQRIRLFQCPAVPREHSLNSDYRILTISLTPTSDKTGICFNMKNRRRLSPPALICQCIGFTAIKKLCLLILLKPCVERFVFIVLLAVRICFQIEVLFPYKCDTDFFTPAILIYFSDLPLFSSVSE